jgi:ABC-2 type transport system ATP-binding protein
MASEALVTEGLTRRYGARTSLDALTVRVLEGDVYGFLGPNGAGKTTAIRCILGLIRADAGSVTIFGERDPVRQRAHVGAMVETPAFHGWMTGRQNLERAVAFAGQGSKEDIDRALSQVGLLGRDGEKVQGYSLGMRQRLGIARTLVGRPRLLILDEPTNGLDPRGMREVRDLLSQLARDARLTIFISSHLLAEIEQLCSRVGILNQGRLVSEGTVDELIARRDRVLEVEVDARPAEQLAAAVASLPGASLRPAIDGGLPRIALEGLDPAELNAHLTGQGLRVFALIPQRSSLEDVFLSLTTKELT